MKRLNTPPGRALLCVALLCDFFATPGTLAWLRALDRGQSSLLFIALFVPTATLLTDAATRSWLPRLRRKRT